MKMRNRNRTGATTIEMAFVAPVMFFIFFGMLEWGRFEMVRQSMSTATFSGARAGIVPGITSQQVEEQVTKVLQIYFVSDAQVSATMSDTECHVHVAVPMAKNGFFLSKYFGDTTLEREFYLQTQ